MGLIAYARRVSPEDAQRDPPPAGGVFLISRATPTKQFLRRSFFFFGAHKRKNVLLSLLLLLYLHAASHRGDVNTLARLFDKIVGTYLTLKKNKV